MQAGDDIMDHPTGVGGNALLSTLINHVAGREGEIEPAEIGMILQIVSSLAGRISPEAMAMAQAKLAAIMTLQSEMRQVETRQAETSHAETMDAVLPQAEPVDQDDGLGEASQPHATLSEDDMARQGCDAGNGSELPPHAVDEPYTVSFTDMMDQPHLAEVDQEHVKPGPHDPPVTSLTDENATGSIRALEAASPVTRGHQLQALPVSIAPETNAEALPPSAATCAATCTPTQLLALAAQASPSHQLSNMIVARGNPEALAVIARNPAARFAKSSLTTLVEFAASDLSLREALCTRGDLGDMILDRLWPYLSVPGKAGVLAAGCHGSHAEARQLCAGTMLTAGDGIEEDGTDETGNSRSAEAWNAAIDARDATLCQAMRSLDAEGRIVDVAIMLAARGEITPDMALTLLLGSYDRGAVLLARLAGCDDDSLASLIHVRGRAGARLTADRRGPLHAFGRLGEDEARAILGGFAARLVECAGREAGREHPIQCEPGLDALAA